MSMSPVIVTIDGPSGAGKSSVARALAARLGFDFLDTGAMYRAVARAALDRHTDLKDPTALTRLIDELDIQLRGSRVYVDGQDVTDRIRTREVTQSVRFVADNLSIRDRLSDLQRQAAESVSIVTEGRDQGTVVFRNAHCKIFLTASPEERARRRHQERLADGIESSFDDVLRRQTERDQHDRDRRVGRLERAQDAVEVRTDGLTIDQVVDQLESLVRRRIAE